MTDNTPSAHSVDEVRASRGQPDHTDTIGRIRTARGQRQQTDIDKLRADRRERRGMNDRKDTE